VRGRTGTRGRLARLALFATLASILGAIVGLGVVSSARYVHILTHPGCWRADHAPEEAGIEGALDQTLTSHDGLELSAWYVPPRNSAAIVLLGGLGSGRDGLLPEGALLARHGYGVLMLDARACALPSGESTLGYLEALDVQQAVVWLVQQTDVDHVGAVGFSAGGVTAILAAAADPRIEAVVAEGGFADLASDLTGEYRQGNLVARIAYLLNPLFFRIETGVDPALISPLKALQDISPRPLLMIYGDREADSAHAWQQLEAAGEATELWIVPDCGHGGYLQAAAEEWTARVVEFFDQAFEVER
jgi:dipeptidyl aminopeptidase/acylaminoacyl peptidase